MLELLLANVIDGILKARLAYLQVSHQSSFRGPLLLVSRNKVVEVEVEVEVW